MDAKHKFKVGDRVQRTSFPKPRDFTGKSGTVKVSKPDQDSMRVLFDGETESLFFAGQISERFTLQPLKKDRVQGFLSRCTERPGSSLNSGRGCHDLPKT